MESVFDLCVDHRHDQFDKCLPAGRDAAGCSTRDQQHKTKSYETEKARHDQGVEVKGPEAISGGEIGEMVIYVFAGSWRAFGGHARFYS